MRSVRNKGRGAALNTPNRFERLHRIPLETEPDTDDLRPVKTAFYKDTSRSILAKNDSPDLDFTFSLNPYRGCEHGCIYCYARPSHEYLGFSAGVDFESKIMVKLDAPELLAREFRKRGWEPQVVALSGNTDCYQPAEQKLRITRRCLEVFLEYRNPVGIVTKNALILRDIDILGELAKYNLVHVMISVTSLRHELIRVMEPRTPPPARRLQTIETLARNGIPVGVNAAPIIPGLTDEELPAILREAAAHGAKTAGYILVRLPGAVEPLFLDWLQREFPERAPKVLSRIRDTRSGALSDARFGSRMRGEGEIADTVRSLFRLHVDRYGLGKRWSGLSSAHFRRTGGGQHGLFDN
ncbi:MAG: PA0069 family radical SAM protein [Bacteroidota bacterium]